VVSRNENLFLTDIDSDGQIDILAGRSDGSLEYWRNSGSLVFNLEVDDYLGLQSSVLRLNIACTTADLDADGNADLLFGDHNGMITIIPDYRHATVNSWPIDQIVFNPLLGNQTYPFVAQNLGGRIWPTVVNLFNATRPAIITGNVMGGVSVLKHDEGESLPEIPSISIFPNPADKNETLNLLIDRPAYFEIVSLLGQRLSDPIRIQGFEKYQYVISKLSPGMYILKFTVAKKSYSRRLVIE
jgi:hypothetical protein